jgi:predicted translin family RNA/ssDNA-binding protein
VITLTRTTVVLIRIYRSVQKNDKTYKEANDKQNEIIQLFKKLSNDIQGLNYHRYSKSFSGAFEEFVMFFKKPPF